MTQPFPALQPQDRDMWQAPDPARIGVPTHAATQEVEIQTGNDLTSIIKESVKPSFALTLDKEIGIVGDAYDAFELSNDPSITSPSIFEKSVETKKEKLVDLFKTKTTDILAERTHVLPQTAQIINNRFYADLPKDQEGRRIEAIRPVLQAKLVEMHDGLIEEAIPFLRQILVEAAVDFKNDHEYQDFALEVAQLCVDRLFLNRKVKNDKNEEKDEIGLNTYVELLKEYGDEYKVGRSVAIGGAVLGVRKSKVEEKDALIKDGKDTLIDMAALIEKHRKQLAPFKDKLLSEWLTEHIGEGIDESKSIARIKDLAERFGAELSKRFYSEDNINYIKDTFIAPELEKLGLIEKKAPVRAGAPLPPPTFAAPTNERPKDPETDPISEFTPKLLSTVPPESAVRLATHIGEYIIAGGDKNILKGAFEAAEKLPEELRFDVIKGLLKKPHKPRTPKSN